MQIGINGIYLEGKRTGIGRYLESLLREWAGFKCDDQIILYYLSEEPQDSFLQEKVFKKVKVYLVEAKQQDIFEWEFVHNPIDVFFSALYDLPYSLRSPAVITIHDMIHESHPEAFNDIQLQYLRERTKFGIEKAQRIITDSHFSYHEIVRYFPDAEEKTIIIPLAASPIFREKEQEGDYKKSALGVSSPFILYVGAVTPKRHIKPIFDAFSALYSRYSEWSVVTIGRNVTFPHEDLQTLATIYNEKVGRRAFLYEEFVDDNTLVCLYNEADIFIYLSTYEGFGMPPLEAMACGTPVITTNCCSLPEVVGEAAMKVDPYNIDEIIWALDTMMGSESIRESFRRLGRLQSKKFSWKRTALETLDVIRSVV